MYKSLFALEDNSFSKYNTLLLHNSPHKCIFNSYNSANFPTSWDYSIDKADRDNVLVGALQPFDVDVYMKDSDRGPKVLKDLVHKY